MKNIIIVLGFAMLLLNPAGLRAAEPIQDQAQGDEKEAKFCPVCGPEDEMEGLAFSYKYEGKKYSFCSMDCMKEFKKNPEKYSKALDHKDSDDHAGHDHK